MGGIFSISKFHLKKNWKYPNLCDESSAAAFFPHPRVSRYFYTILPVFIFFPLFCSFFFLLRWFVVTLLLSLPKRITIDIISIMYLLVNKRNNQLMLFLGY